jgi:hypothetical protein
LDQNTQYNIIDQDKLNLKKALLDTKLNFIYEFISCKKNFNISQIFQTIISSVVFPIKPLLKQEKHIDNIDKFKLNPMAFVNVKFHKALVRVFRILNSKSKNFGILNKEEFIKIHKEIFGKNLEEENLENITDFLNENLQIFEDSLKNKQNFNSKKK